MLTYFKYILSLVSSKRKRSKAFTLIELLIVTAIATAMMTTLVIQQNSWNDDLALRSQAYEVVLMLRQAQLYSLGVRENVNGVGDKFNVGYGVFFYIDKKDQYIYFADKSDFNNYNIGEELETKLFKDGVNIKKMCGKKSNGSESCVETANGNFRSVTVSFFRPDVGPDISFRNNGGNITNNLYSPASIYLGSSDSNQESIIKIENNGHISLE